MTSLAVLIPVSIGMGLVGLLAFLWAMRTNQFDDPEGNAWRVITSDDQPPQDQPREKEDERHERKTAHPEHRDPSEKL